MLVDRDFIADHTSFVEDGIEERAFKFDVGSDQCFGLLYQPPEPSNLGFVVCHSYALEFLTLRRMERAIARNLASMGHSVIAFHSRGYGDSGGYLADTTLDRHREDIQAAAHRLWEATGALEVGLIGARFGALLAGLVARDGDIKKLILVDPEFSAARYFKGLIRDKNVVELVNSDGGSPLSMDSALHILQTDGTLDLLGHQLYGHFYSSLQEVDITNDVGRFSGDALIVQVTKQSSPSRAAEAFAERARSQGGSCELKTVHKPRGVTIGGPAFVNKNDRKVREDLQIPVVEEISSLVKEWMRG
jgi:pimeloyl-ACP methyl ester carboxylesterase